MIAGIDFSSRAVDLVLLDETTDRAEWHRYELTGQDAFERARQVRLRVPGPAHSLWDDCLACGIEQPRGRFALVDLGRIQGAILSCLPSRTLVQPWNPMQWRLAAGLPNGNATKAQVWEYARSRWVDWPAGEVPADATDAYCIALATRSLLQKAAA